MGGKLTVLEVGGDNDYHAMSVEQGIGVKKAYDLAKENGGIVELDDDTYAIIHEFGEVDPEFIDFVSDRFIDYDYAKTHNFYVIDNE